MNQNPPPVPNPQRRPGPIFRQVLKDVGLSLVVIFGGAYGLIHLYIAFGDG